MSQEKRHVFYDKGKMAHFFLFLPSFFIDIQIFLFTYVNWSILSTKRPSLDMKRKVKLFTVRNIFINRKSSTPPLHHRSNKNEISYWKVSYPSLYTIVQGIF